MSAFTPLSGEKRTLSAPAQARWVHGLAEDQWVQRPELSIRCCRSGLNGNAARPDSSGLTAAAPAWCIVPRCKSFGARLFFSGSQRRDGDLQLLNSAQDLPGFRLPARANIEQFNAPSQVFQMLG